MEELAVVMELSGVVDADVTGRAGTVKLERPPFHAIPVVAGVTFTFGGLRVDDHARVLTAAGEPVGGLYAAGGTMGGLHGGPGAGPPGRRPGGGALRLLARGRPAPARRASVSD